MPLLLGDRYVRKLDADDAEPSMEALDLTAILFSSVSSSSFHWSQ